MVKKNFYPRLIVPLQYRWLRTRTDTESVALHLRLKEAYEKYEEALEMLDRTYKLNNPYIPNPDTLPWDAQ